jgi:hypothetical protein
MVTSAYDRIINGISIYTYGHHTSAHACREYSLNSSSKAVFYTLNYSSQSTPDSSSCLYHPQNLYLHLLGFSATGRRSQYWISSSDRHIKNTFLIASSLVKTKLHNSLQNSLRAERLCHQAMALWWTDLKPSCNVTHIVKRCSEYSLGSAHHTNNDVNKRKTNKTGWLTPTPWFLSCRKKAIKWSDD